MKAESVFRNPVESFRSTSVVHANPAPVFCNAEKRFRKPATGFRNAALVFASAKFVFRKTETAYGNTESVFRSSVAVFGSSAAAFACTDLVHAKVGADQGRSRRVLPSRSRRLRRVRPVCQARIRRMALGGRLMFYNPGQGVPPTHCLRWVAAQQCRGEETQGAA
ncbi:hypothetical protein [Lysobacter capsici]|uniref:hypothetical protein n=1 Tax=Lysobacter capsici TaxID=435897 RepID=UPI001C002D45|nr:hypothetical protein [Lysobacter capsici]QWF16383.1 hypothetical protein KME82_21920 [Lysobacter capsici]